VPSASLEQFAGWDCVRHALADIRASHDELERFFSEVFDRLGMMAGELSAREQELGQVGCELQDHEHAAASAKDQQMQQLLTEAGRERAELRNLQETIQSQIARLASVASELAEHHSGLTDLRSGLLEQERTQMESELETVRNNAAKTAEALAEQKRLAAQQQAEWAAELKRMRRLLENVAARMDDGMTEATADKRPSEPAASAAALAAVAGCDPVLDSVVAQFEMLQKDVARRQARRC
jgi:chromosome segregation ATPase